jgi:hypothetical protein
MTSIMTSVPRIACFVAIPLIFAAGHAPAWSQNADHGTPHAPATTALPQAGPAGVTVEFENDSVLVLRIRMEPHEKTPMHDIVGARVVVWLSNTHLRDTSADGRTAEIRRSAGAVDWVPPQRHAGENLGDQPIEWLAILPKTKDPARP